MNYTKLKKDIDFIKDKMSNDFGKYETYCDMVGDIAYILREENMDEHNTQVLSKVLASEIISNHDCYACDKCDKINNGEDIFCSEYADCDNKDDVKVADYMDKQMWACVCPECYGELKEMLGA